MDATLRDLVRENGFAAVFESLKTLVTNEYERSKADYEFLSALLKKPEPVAETKEVVVAAQEEPVQQQEDDEAKLVNIISSKAPASMKKRVIRGTQK